MKSNQAITNGPTETGNAQVKGLIPVYTTTLWTNNETRNQDDTKIGKKRKANLSIGSSSMTLSPKCKICV